MLIPVLKGSAQDIYTDNPIAKIARESSPAVVNIDVETLVTRSFTPFPDDPFFREFFGEEFKKFNRTIPMKGRGSGFIVSSDGKILTNNHVVENADKIEVTLSNGKIYEAQVLGKDPTFDLAVIKIEGKDFPFLDLGDSDLLEVGEWVVAIGNPFGLEHTVTAGVLSAKNRSIHAGNVNFDGFLQTDAAINPGNSGGPLLDLEGQVIGINSAIIPYAQGIGFAIPVNMAKDVMDDLVNYGKVRRGWLGVYVQPLTSEFVEAYDLESDNGAVISDVVQGSPAEKAGLRRGDVVTEVDGQEISDHRDFVYQIRKSMAGDTVKLTLIRDGQVIQVEAVLSEIDSASGEMGTMDSLGITRIGIEISRITPELREKYAIQSEEGVVITSVEQGSIAARAGLQEGDVIIEINGIKMNDPGEWNRIRKNDMKAIVMLLSREGRTFFISMSL
ncbi:MAG: Do family serine endopeptidase [Synergistales bacterium]|nr:Do family serine endopeptidase [Synergistales bacterium]